MPRLKRFQCVGLVGFILGGLVPLFWGVLGFVLFNIPEGRLSRTFWHVVYPTCPFWSIDGEKTLLLMPLLNGCMYAAIAVAIFGFGRHNGNRPR